MCSAKFCGARRCTWVALSTPVITWTRKQGQPQLTCHCCEADVTAQNVRKLDFNSKQSGMLEKLPNKCEFSPTCVAANKQHMHK